MLHERLEQNPVDLFWEGGSDEVSDVIVLPGLAEFR